jgi:hypothetical protein
MRVVSNPIVAGLAGAGVTTGVAVAGGGLVPPTVPVALGASVAALAHLPREGRRHYRQTGAAFLLGAAGLLSLPVGTASAARWTLVPSLLWFGLVSAAVALLFVGVRVVGRALGLRIWPDDLAERVARTFSAVGSTLLVAYTVVQTKERLVRSGVTGLLGVGSLAADVLGYDLVVELGVLQGALDVTLVTFVGSVAVGFYTLASWEAGRRVAASTAETVSGGGGREADEGT